jgi:preprotein translocase subunit SecG
MKYAHGAWPRPRGVLLGGPIPIQGAFPGRIFMQTVLLVVHLIACIALVIAVMLQRSEGGALGMGGGGTGGLISGRGAANVLVRTTMVLAAIFFTTSITMTRLNAENAQQPSDLQRQIEQQTTDPLGANNPLAAPAPAPSTTTTPPTATTPDPLAPVNPSTATPPAATTPAPSTTTPATPPASTPQPAPAQPDPLTPAQNGGGNNP